MAWRYLVCEWKSLKRTQCVQPNWRYDAFEEEYLQRIGFLAIPTAGDNGIADRLTALAESVATLEAQRNNILSGVAEASDADTRRILLDQATVLSSDISERKKDLVELRESAARFNEAATSVVDFEAVQEEMLRLAREDRREAQRLLASFVERIDLESDEGEIKPMRRVATQMVTGRSYDFVIDEGRV